MIRKLSALLAISALVLAACTPPAPALTASKRSPGAAATDVSVDATVSAVFSVQPTAASVATALSLTSGEDAIPVSGSVTYDNASRTITFTPATSLDYATKYTASLSADVRTSGGTRLTGPRSWTFTTENAPVVEGVVSVTIDQSDISLLTGETATLTATVEVNGEVDDSVAWSSDDETVATVLPTGVVTAVASGTATITATSVADPALSDSVGITVVVAPAVTSLSIAGTDRVVTLSNDVTFMATVAVEGSASNAVTWTSSNETVATIDPNTGEAALVGAGDTTITATSVFDNTFTDSVTLTVAAPLAFADDYATLNGTANIQTAINLETPAVTGGYGTITYALAAASSLPTDFIVDDGADPVTYSVILDGATGTISGATGYPGTYTGFVTATDELGQTATAAYSIALLLDFTYVEADLVTPATEFVYNPSAATPEYVVPGIQVRISGVQNTDWLPVDLSNDLQFSFTVLGATDIAGSAIASPDSTGVTINTVEGTFYRTGPVTDADWSFNVILTNVSTSETATQLVTWLNSDWIAVP